MRTLPILFYGTSVVISVVISLMSTACKPSIFSPPSHSTSQIQHSKTADAEPIWSSNFESPQWQDDWKIRSQGQWGIDNTSIVPDETGRFSQVLRVKFPAASASPAAARSGSPLGGAQFYSTQASQKTASQTQVRLSYFLRFSNDFDFVKGGKLPGLYGGKGNSGGDQSNGTDGFSTRLMWRRKGAGEVYAYLPKRESQKAEKYGTSIGRGRWVFKPGVWHQIEQELKLNRPDRNDGSIRIWLDGKLVLEERNLQFRSDSNLHIDGVFFSTFFGGNDRTWATPKPVHIDFADFKLLRPAP